MNLEEEHEIPFAPQIITEAEAENFPKTEKPLPPGLDDEVEKIQKVKEEKERDDHPAFKLRDEYRNQGHKVDED